MELIKEIKKALNQITPAPWMRKDNEIWTVKTDVEGYHTQIVKKTKCTLCDYDLNFITSAPEWLNSLIELVEQQKDELDTAYEAYVELDKEFKQLDMESAKDVDELRAKDTLIESQKEEIKRLTSALDQIFHESPFPSSAIDIARKALQKETTHIQEGASK